MSAKETVMNQGNVKNPQITPIAHQNFYLKIWAHQITPSQ